MKQKPTIIYENTVAGSFVRRINRFTAEVLIDGETELVHVKNTGRLRELLVPKAKVTLQKTLNMNRKTAYDLISVYKPKLNLGKMARRDKALVDKISATIILQGYMESRS